MEQAGNLARHVGNLHRNLPARQSAIGALLILTSAVTAIALAWMLRLVAGTPFLVLAGAAGPAALYAAIIWWMQRREGRPSALLAACFLWGAASAAFLSQATNDLARVWVGMLAGTDDARALTATWVAPLIEEAAKAAGLILLVALRPCLLRNVRDGVVYGALVGVGFLFTENLTYLRLAVLQGGGSGFGRGVYLRGLLAGANHAIFTATIGAGLGWARSAPFGRARRLAPILAGAAACLQHVAWNGVASGAIAGALCGAEVPGGACRATPAPGDLFVVVPALTLAFLAPGGGTLLYLAARRRARCGGSAE